MGVLVARILSFFLFWLFGSFFLNFFFLLWSKRVFCRLGLPITNKTIHSSNRLASSSHSLRVHPQSSLGNDRLLFLVLVFFFCRFATDSDLNPKKEKETN